MDMLEKTVIVFFSKDGNTKTGAEILGGKMNRFAGKEAIKSQIDKVVI